MDCFVDLLLFIHYLNWESLVKMKRKVGFYLISLLYAKVIKLEELRLPQIDSTFAKS